MPLNAAAITAANNSVKGARERSNATVIFNAVAANHKAATVAALNKTAGTEWNQTDVQAAYTKIDAIITALKNAGLMATS